MFTRLIRPWKTAFKGFIRHGNAPGQGMILPGNLLNISRIFSSKKKLLDVAFSFRVFVVFLHLSTTLFFVDIVPETRLYTTLRHALYCTYSCEESPVSPSW